MYEYKAKLLKVIDGDTVDVDIDLGFGVWLRNERVRIMGIDTPESRTRNKLEKLFGLAAKKRLKELLNTKDLVLKTFKGRGGEDAKGKFGRILGDFNVYYHNDDRWTMVTEIMIKEGHAVEYHGGSKEAVEKQHLVNRERVLAEGLINEDTYNKYVASGKYE
jgi:micrococcal nuclease